MAKYSYELKKEIVTAYFNGEGSQSYLMKKYGVSAKKRIQPMSNSEMKGLFVPEKTKVILSNTSYIL